METPPNSGETLPPGLVYADPDRPHPPQPYRFPASMLPPAPPAAAPGELTRTCALCDTKMPLSALGEWADRLACLDTAACTARAQAAGLYPQPAEAQ